MRHALLQGLKGRQPLEAGAFQACSIAATLERALPSLLICVQAGGIFGKRDLRAQVEALDQRLEIRLGREHE